MTDSQALRDALRDGIETAERDENTFVPVDRAVLASLLSDLDRVERERDGLAEALENLLAHTDGVKLPTTAHIMRARARQALSSSPVVGGGETNTSSQGCGTDHSGDLLNAGGERVDAAAPVVWSLVFSEGYGVNAATTFKTREKAEAYAANCSDPKPRVVALTILDGEQPEPTVEAAAALAPGWVAVPLAPTDAMLQGGCAKHTPGQPMSRTADRECPSFEARRRIWADMIQTAPAHPVTEGEG